MPRATGSTIPPERAVIDGMPPASVTSLNTSAYATPSELAPKVRTNSSATRRARPVSRSTRAISIAPSTSQTEGDENPPRASAIGRRPTSTSSVSPMMTMAAPGSGWTASTRSPSVNASSNRFSISIADASPVTKPSAFSSNA